MHKAFRWRGKWWQAPAQEEHHFLEDPPGVASGVGKQWKTSKISVDLYLDLYRSVACCNAGGYVSSAQVPHPYTSVNFTDSV